jgi:hypothetical protein
MPSQQSPGLAKKTTGRVEREISFTAHYGQDFNHGKSKSDPVDRNPHAAGGIAPPPAWSIGAFPGGEHGLADRAHRQPARE